MSLPPPREVDRALALPPGRVGYDLAAPRLLLHSFMPAQAYEALRTTGTLRCPPTPAEPPFPKAYAWMCEQYARRVPGEGQGPLLWAWARTRRRELVNSLSAGDVLVTLRVPRERVLLSDFDDWHAVINQYELHPREIDDEEACRRIDAFWDEREASGLMDEDIEEWPEPLRRRVLASWAQVFQIGPPPRVVQAVTSRFDATDVVDAVTLAGRPAPTSAP
jgi:Domain of unknown function (DUF3841)